MIMTTKQKELYDVIESLPEELSTKVIDYIEYLKFSYMTKAPEDLIIKDDKDLLKKLKKGMEDTANGKVCSVEEAYEEVKEILALKEYKVVLSIQAKEDYKRIISYIKNKLLEPNIAEIYAELIKDEFNILKYNPQKFAIIDYDLLKKYKFRKLIIKNYIAFYRINEDEKIVNVERILYSATDWKNKL